ncbi:Oidioi.mRNA.OKI2018_I69.PAR.g11866.t1.cds [Oikopleura dioica]|uniref:Oidioi.mRNA.OKI2018_I69.PAR.g11866.t1.cds n=1 Tax=Oikopleura dioica TaxID=34765 RepID=A0ABN7RXP5_OIKDI|nr:Oidioi.mRNA.OKI2018_I69.PAR.g11866.t1.cds [Oikopleura dioica]
MPFYARPNQLQLDNRGYYMDRRGFYVCYCDGSSFNNNDARRQLFSGYGCFFGPGRAISQHSDFDDRYSNTNNFAELFSIVMALRHAVKFGLFYVQVRSDSTWCVNCLNGEWNPNCHLDLFDEIQYLCGCLNQVEFCFVRRNSEYGHQQANELAQRGASRHQNRFYAN